MSQTINFIPVDRYWFLTWTTYGTWLPGDPRGFVGSYRTDTGEVVVCNIPGTPVGPAVAELCETAASRLRGPPILLVCAQAAELLAQFQETSVFRRWLLLSVGIMRTHLHVIVGVPGDPDPEKILGDFKAYGTRRLNDKCGTPPSSTWWTAGGSKRKLANDRSVEAAVEYVRRQPNPLVIWTREEGRVKR